MRRAMFVKTSNFIRRELFILDAELSKPVLDLRMKTIMIEKLQMINMNCLTPNTVMDFVSAQSKQIKTIEETLKKVEADISVILIESCKTSMTTFKEENRIAMSDEFFGDDSPMQEKDNCEEKDAFLVGDETHKQMPYT